MRTVFVTLVLAGAAAGGAAYYAKHVAAESPTVYRVATLKRGDLSATISATGTLEPEELVDVGAQVAGLIVEFGPDPHADQVDRLRLDSSRKTRYWQRSIPLPTKRRSNRRKRRSNARRPICCSSRRNAKQAEQEWKRAEGLLPKKAIADTDYDTAMANYKAARANLAVGKATIRQNEAALQDGEESTSATRPSNRRSGA